MDPVTVTLITEGLKVAIPMSIQLAGLIRKEIEEGRARVDDMTKEEALALLDSIKSESWDELPTDTGTGA
ncbi:MAG TPA: hypothetical protein VGK71_01190 [Nitrospirota bacterium]|jgi:hypothetical protein